MQANGIWTPILMAAPRTSNFDAVVYLIEQQAEVDCFDERMKQLFASPECKNYPCLLELRDRNSIRNVIIG